MNYSVIAKTSCASLLGKPEVNICSSIKKHAAFIYSIALCVLVVLDKLLACIHKHTPIFLVHSRLW